MWMDNPTWGWRASDMDRDPHILMGSPSSRHAAAAVPATQEGQDGGAALRCSLYFVAGSSR